MLNDNLVASPRMADIYDVAHHADRSGYINAIHPEDLKKRQDAYAFAYEHGKLDYDGRVVHRDGSVHWVE